jgi:hypothetical protein
MTDQNALVVSDRYMPVMNIAAAVARYNALVEFTRIVMKKEKDYGIIPGTDKPTLLKPGAEKLCTLFGLAPVFELTDKITDFSGGLFYFQYRCILQRDGVAIASGLGSCNSREKKYRYRQMERTCPVCKKAAIIKGKEQYGGGWLCFTKKGGCGAKFPDGAPEIESQAVGQVENTEPFDLVNTIDKMAQKRSLVAAVLIGANASEFYTQDMEDIVDGDWHDASAPSVPQRPAAPRQQETVGPLDGLRKNGAMTTSKGTRLDALTDEQLKTVSEKATNGLKAAAEYMMSTPDDVEIAAIAVMLDIPQGDAIMNYPRRIDALRVLNA